MPPGPEAARASSYLDALRDAGLLRAYSEPADRVVFAPDGTVQFLTLSPVPGRPVAPQAISRGGASTNRASL